MTDNDSRSAQQSAIAEFTVLGSTNEVKIAIAKMVYDDLVNIMKVTSLRQYYDAELNLLYFRITRPNSDSEIVIPVLNSNEVDLLQFESIQRRLSSSSKRITMAVCDQSSAIVYYSVVNQHIDA